MLEVDVTDVFFGDPGLRSLYVPRNCSPLMHPGSTVLLAVRGDNYSESAWVVTDTTENRSNLKRVIEDRGTTRIARGFLDGKALLDKAESLLNSYLNTLSERFPDHAYLYRSDARQQRKERVT